MNQSKWISVEDELPKVKEERYQCLAKVHQRRQSFYENGFAVVQDWVIRKHPENFIVWQEIELPKT